MNEYRHSSHSVFRIHIHLVWGTKYRRKILEGEIGHRFRDLAQQICSEMDVKIIQGAVASDHVHMLVSIPTKVAISKLVQRLKGRTSYKMQQEFQTIKKVYWGQRMWARGYFACSTGNVTDEMIQNYIESHVNREQTFKVLSDFESEDGGDDL